MSRVILALLVLVAVANAFPRNSLTSHICGPNEEYVTCGSACEPSCGLPISRICTLQCIIGCQCKQGFLRSGNTNECVPPSQCELLRQTLRF